MYELLRIPRRLIFVEYRATSFSSEVKQLFASLSASSCHTPEEVLTYDEDIMLLPTRGRAFVSPANSIGYMDGGIDLAYSAMFPGCQRRLQKRIAQLGITTALGRPYLPVGSAVALPQDAARSTFLISAPTMFLPEDVSRTRNAYHCFTAALQVYARCVVPLSGGRVNTLVCPALCCGYGLMDASESARQISAAFRDFFAALVSKTGDVEQGGRIVGNEVYLGARWRDEEQQNQQRAPAGEKVIHLKNKMTR